MGNWPTVYENECIQIKFVPETNEFIGINRHVGFGGLAYHTEFNDLRNAILFRIQYNKNTKEFVIESNGWNALVVDWFPIRTFIKNELPSIYETLSIRPEESYTFKTLGPLL